VKERNSQYKWEKEQIMQLMKDNTDAQGILTDFDIPDFLHMDTAQIIREEEKEIKAL
jgi:hypothetical protein